MPQFFFDYRDERGNIQHDTDGLDLPDADAAYLEAYRAAIDIWAEARHVGRDPGRGMFEIRNLSGCVVVELPFTEALGFVTMAEPRRVRPAPTSLGWSKDERNELTELEATLALAERHVADQRARLTRTRARGHDTQIAERLLATLLDTQTILQHRLDELSRRLSKSQP
jgi:Domain of unknown function (DUF6894)